MKLFALILFLTFTLFAEAKNCAVYLAENNITVSEDPTENLIAFLSELYKKQTLNEQSISKIANGDFENPLKAKVSFDSDHQIFFEVYQDLFSQAIDRNKLQKWAANFVKVEQKTTEEKNESKEQTKFARVEKFLRVEKGSFSIETQRGQYDVTLTTPFEMTATHITRGLWRAIMGDTTFDSILKDGPNHPVTGMSWWTIITFANRLSEKEGLPIVYDMSAIKEWSGNLEDGSLSPINDAEAAKLKINAPDGNIYKAKGYRLPTIYEHFYVISDRGRSNTKTFTDIYDSNIREYATSLDMSAPFLEVAELKPYVIDGQLFYDLYGNVHEVFHSMGVHDEKLMSGVDPVDTEENPAHAALRKKHRLVSPAHRAEDLSDFNNYQFSSSTANSRGIRSSFRLVRSLEK